MFLLCWKKKYGFGGKFHKKNAPYIEVKHKIIHLLKVEDMYISIYIFYLMKIASLFSWYQRRKWQIMKRFPTWRREHGIWIIGITTSKILWRWLSLYSNRQTETINTFKLCLKSLKSNHQQLIDGSVVLSYPVALHLIRK